MKKTVKKEYERPQSWVIAMSQDIMAAVNIGVSGGSRNEGGRGNAPRYQGNDDWDEE